MKKLVFSLTLISSIVTTTFGKNFICDIKGYKEVEIIDNFGNKNKEYIPKIKSKIIKFIKTKDYINLEKFFAENIYININGYHGFKKLLNDRIEKATFFSGTLRGYLEGAIESGQLPSSVEINTLNIATVKNKVKINANIYNVVGAFANYFLSSKSINTFRDRLLLMISFLLQKNSILIPFTCEDNIYSYFSEKLLGEYITTGFINLLEKKDKDALYLAFLMLKHRYDEVDKFLLKNKRVKKLFLIGRNHYISFGKIHKTCNLNDEFDFKVRALCFQNKTLSVKTFNRIMLNSENKIGHMKTLYSGSIPWGYLMKNYCNFKKGDLLPKVFRNDNNEYCVYQYEGIKK